MSCLMATQRIVDKYCQFLYQDSGEAADHDNSKASPITPVGPRRLAGKANECNDSVLAYASETLKLGLFLMEFVDSIREGDGHRIIRC